MKIYAKNFEVSPKSSFFNSWDLVTIIDYTDKGYSVKKVIPYSDFTENFVYPIFITRGGCYDINELINGIIDGDFQYIKLTTGGTIFRVGVEDIRLSPNGFSKILKKIISNNTDNLPIQFLKFLKQNIDYSCAKYILDSLSNEIKLLIEL